MNHLIRVLFIFLSILVLSFFTQKILVTSDLLLESYSRTFSLNKAHELVNSIIKYQWIGYVAIPFVLIVKWLLVSALIYTALFFAQIQIAFKKLWQIAVQAEWVFVIAALVKFCWFYFFAKRSSNKAITRSFSASSFS